MPAVVVIDANRVVRFADVHPDWLVRTEADVVIDAVRALGPGPGLTGRDASSAARPDRHCHPALPDHQARRLPVPVEFIGIAHTSDYSETNAALRSRRPARLPVPASPRVHEQSGFDRVLVAHSSSMPDGFTVASQVLNATERLGVLLAHRPGFIAPTDRRPRVRHHRRLPPRPDRAARDLRRRRRRPGPRRRLHRQADPVPAHRRVPRHRRARVVVGRAASTTRASSTG